jgi:hypothetical protein
MGTIEFGFTTSWSKPTNSDCQPVKDKRSTSLVLPTKRRWRGRQHQHQNALFN